MLDRETLFDGAAGQRSRLGVEPRTFSRACDVGMTSLAASRRRSVRAKGPGAKPRLLLAPPRKVAATEEVRDAEAWCWVRDDGRVVTRETLFELRGTTGAALRRQSSFFSSQTSRPSMSRSYTLSFRARRLVHQGDSQRFFVTLGAVAVGVDWSDAVFLVDRSNRRTRTVPDAALATSDVVPLALTVTGAVLSVLAFDRRWTVAFCEDDDEISRRDARGRGGGANGKEEDDPFFGGQVGLRVDDSRVAVEDWQVTDHEAQAERAARDADEAARRAARNANFAVQHLRKRLDGSHGSPTAPRDDDDDDDTHTNNEEDPAAADAETAASSLADDNATQSRPRSIRRPSQRPDVGLLCQGCGRPFTRLGEALVLWRAQPRSVSLRFHAACFADFFPLQQRRPHQRVDYADAWLRARVLREDTDERRRRLQSSRWTTERLTPGELVRAGSVAVDRPDGSKCLSAPLAPSSYAALVAHRAVVVAAAAAAAAPGTKKWHNLDCPVCMHSLSSGLDDDDENKGGRGDSSKGRLVLELPCSHVFHEACLRPWFRRCSLCPTCRTDVAPAAAVLPSTGNNSEGRVVAPSSTRKKSTARRQQRRPSTTPHRRLVPPTSSSLLLGVGNTTSYFPEPEHRALRSR